MRFSPLAGRPDGSGGIHVRTHPASVEDEYIDVSYTPFYSDRRVAVGGSLFRDSLILAVIA